MTEYTRDCIMDLTDALKKLTNELEVNKLVDSKTIGIVWRACDELESALNEQPTT